MRHSEEHEFDAWLDNATERADPFMAWLAIVFALVVGYELAVDLGPRATVALEAAGWTIWAVFFVEFSAKLYLAPSKRGFLRRHWLQALFLVVPVLRILRFVRLLRLGRALPASRVLSASYRNVGTAKRLARSRLGYLAAVSAIGTIAVAEVCFVFERDAPDGAFSSFGDALLWSFATVVALQGDPVPTTVGARLAMLAGFVLGLVIVASLAGTVGAYLVDERRERAEREELSAP